MRIAVAAGLAVASALACAAPRRDPARILGLYAVPAPACSLAAAAGFTIVHDYGFETRTPADAAAFAAEARAYLDRAHALGLRVLLGLPRAWLRERREPLLRQAVRLVGDHPAILAWYEDEMAQGGDIEAVVLLAQIVGDEDPQHGLVIEEALRDPRLLPLARARMFTYYPATQAARAAGRLQTLPERFPVATLATPFWPVLQAFGRDLIRGSPRQDLVAPTADELRFSLHSALIAGARGIFFYPYMHATRYDAALAAAGRWAYVDYRPLPEVAPDLWRAVLDCRALAAELLDLLRDAEPATGVGADLPPHVEMGAWNTDRGLLVLVANPTSEARGIRLQVPLQEGAAFVIRVAGAARGAGRPFAAREVEIDVSGPGGTAVLIVPAP